MTTSLISFDNKHIVAAQAIMADDRVLEGFIHNLSNGPITEIHGYLQDERFLHVTRMLGGCKLNLSLISDVALQLDLSVDGPVIMGSMVVLDVNRWLPVPIIVLGLVVTTIFTCSSEQPIYVFIGDKFERMPYIGSNIIEYVPSEFLVNRSMWDTNVPLIVYTMATLSAEAMTSGLTTYVQNRCRVSTTLCTTTSLFYHGGSSAQPLYHKVEDKQWEARMTSHSSTEESDGYEDEDNDRDEDEYEGGVKMKTMITINN
ncbi:hypothetical protein Goshw_027813 [Gossypium schwendimanii]|uniref:Uncharacterized protein n=1 Tax=Gossypium schwendimanii TaxID=34291 RepID=A0A7J9MEA0_GOSSC|nr:hypothetical protein [Gossypium schwendimanii]